MRRIQTYEFKLSVLILFIISFIIPANISENGTIKVYNFGFPCDYWSIYQWNEGSSQLFNNLFNGNKGMNINILGLFFNLFIIYTLLILLKKIYIKIMNQ
ncbi:hypothetical protein [Clostridium butyricum]|uniref:hypothetical protein n=1 Tax=Clostridium butyricum TaxID=1492 RepID=UPI00210343FB|nr:hypothetical protein [Clostridium butyricum]MCQ2013859.1 hypothetical protein [Clostridium butyricum]MCQ2024761.1 hypothetical protein [Clostridium butyricum]